MQHLTVYLMGEDHEDPACHNLVTKHVVKASQLGINVSVLPERPIDAYASINELIIQTRDHIDYLDALHALKQMAREKNQTPTNPRFRAHQNSFDAYVLKNWKVKTPEEYLIAVGVLSMGMNNIDFLHTREACRERLKMYQIIAAMQPQVRLQCIDISVSKLPKVQEQHDLALTIEKEALRMTHMSQCIAEEAGLFVNTGGVIFVCNLGIVHPHRLAYLVTQALQKRNLPKQLMVSIVPLRMHSSHVNVTVAMKKRSAEIEATLNAFSVNDSAEMRAFYEDLPCLDLHCKTKLGDQYSCPEFDDLMNHHVFSRMGNELTRGFVYTPTLRANRKVLLFERIKEASPIQWFIDYNGKTMKVDDVEAEGHAQIPSNR